MLSPSEHDLQLLVTMIFTSMPQKWETLHSLPKRSLGRPRVVPVSSLLLSELPNQMAPKICNPLTTELGFSGRGDGNSPSEQVDPVVLDHHPGSMENMEVMKKRTPMI